MYPSTWDLYMPPCFFPAGISSARSFASGEGVQAALALQVVSSGARPSVEHLSAKGKKGRTGEEEDTSPVAEREEENL